MPGQDRCRYVEVPAESQDVGDGSQANHLATQPGPSEVTHQSHSGLDYIPGSPGQVGGEGEGQAVGPGDRPELQPPPVHHLVI